MRRSFREDGKVKNETLGNLSHLPEPLIDIIRRSRKGERFVPVAPAKRSPTAPARVNRRRLDDGTPIHSVEPIRM